ncbi:hypothetical protein ACFXKS_15780 [Streptomyces scopuliridis]|uniref:hypothetical protein n=1 Tax=Streptomyces scopuliridis TaxID=452529 RepID=UPI003682840C
MQDGTKRGEGAAEWLREHFKDNPAPEISLRLETATSPEPGSYERLLEILFTPQSGDTAA